MKILKKIAGAVFQSNWYPNKKIILESDPDLSCQTYPIFEYMLQQRLNDSYKIIWRVTDKTKYSGIKIHNVFFRNYDFHNLYEKVQNFYDLCTSRAILNSKRYIGKIYDRQFYFYLMHGACIKSRLKHTREDEVNESDGSICLSPFLRKFDVAEEHISEERFIISGYPRNDYLFEKTDYTKAILQSKKYSYVIVWMPTFRRSKDGLRVDSYYDFPLGIPCLYSENDCKRLNDELIKNDSVIIIKPHPGQDISLIKNLNLSNIMFLYDIDVEKSGIQLYQFLGSTDALVTDYSSVYYDYLLTKKKIGITIDDLDEYKKTTGFVFDNPLDILKGKYIKNVDDFIDFIQYVISPEDPYFDQREEIAKMVHTYQDNQSTKRTYEYIIKEIERRYSHSN